MAKTYADTLDEQIRAAWMARNDRVTTTPGVRVGDLIRSADSYFLSSDFMRLVDAAAESLPEMSAIEVDDLPSPYAWMTFAEPKRLPFTSPAWELTHVMADGCFWHASGDAVAFTPFSFNDHEWDGMGGFGAILGQRGRPAPGFEAIKYATDWFKSMFLLLSQQSVSETAEEAPPRAARRRADRAGVNPIIRVIRLPRRVREHASAEHGHVEWQSRWIVRGHWRQQPWGPERSRIRPVWIAPHVKGPEDKPLKPVAHRLFVAEAPKP